MGLYFFDDLNSYTLGAAPPSPWSYTLGNAANSQVNVEADPEVGSPGGRVIRVFDNNPPASGVSYATTVKRTMGATVTSRVTFDIRGRTNTTNRFAFGVIDSLGNFFHCFAFNSNTGQSIDSTNDASGASGYPSFSGNGPVYSLNTWYSFRYTYDVSFGLRDYYVNGSLVSAAVAQGNRPGNIAGIGVKSLVVQGQTASTWIDDVRAAQTLITRTGIVRDAVTGVALSGAKVIVIRQTDNTLIASGTTDTNGTFSIAVPAPDEINCVFAAYRGLTELGSARPFVDVF